MDMSMDKLSHEKLISIVAMKLAHKLPSYANLTQKVE